MQWIFYITPLIELICFILSLIYLNNKKVGWYRSFIWLLLFTVIAENTGWAVYFYFHANNHWVYNTFLPIESFFIAWILYKICQPHFNSKPIIIAGLAAFSLSYLIESVKTNFTDYSMVANILFSICAIIVCCMYYYYLLKEENNIVVYKHAPFWIVTGIFLFYFVATSSNLFFKYLVEINKTKLVPIRFTIFLILNLTLYGTWSYAFKCQYKKTISS